MSSEFTLQSLSNVPQLPGVYLFNDKRGRLLYVGKAVNLRNRLRNYLQKNLPSVRIQTMVHQIHRMDFIVTQTEVEALLLENSFIKNNKPQYNVMLRDDKTYPYILITSESFPRALIVRRKSRIGKTFGPFPSTRAARATVRQLHHYFKIRTCDDDLDVKEFEPCLQFHLKRCDAPCNRLVGPEEYGHGVERAVQFLKGETDDLIDELHSEMVLASKSLAFERAANYRDLLGLVNKVRHHQKITKLPEQKIDVIGYTGQGNRTSLIILTIRNGMISRSKHFQLDHDEQPLEELVAHLSHYYLGHADPPAELVLREPNRFDLLSKAMIAGGRTAIGLRNPIKGFKKTLLEMAEENASLHLLDEPNEAVRRLGDILSQHLGLDLIPNRIEGFDISNTQGEHSVASMVSFLDGKPDKKSYRKFKIKTVDGPNDFASMQEVVLRRYRRVLKEGKSLPDLILIDGGLGQLSSAHRSLVELGLGHQPIISLAKKEELVFHLKTNQPIRIPHSDSALKLLQHVRDESHRFGLKFHRQRRSRAMTHSELDGIRGLGPKRIQKLLQTFGSVRGIRDASLSQLVQIVGEKTGRATFEELRGRKGTPS